MNFIVSHFGGALIPLLVAPLTVLLGKLILNCHTRLEALSAPAKQGVIVVIAGSLTALAAFLHADICYAQQCAGDFSNLDLKALVAAALSFAIHEGLKKSE